MKRIKLNLTISAEANVTEGMDIKDFVKSYVDYLNANLPWGSIDNAEYEVTNTYQPIDWRTKSV